MYVFGLINHFVELINHFVESMIETLTNATYECTICCSSIQQQAALWDCITCHHMFHFYCIKKWANTLIAQTSGKVAVYLHFWDVVGTLHMLSLMNVSFSHIISAMPAIICFSTFIIANTQKLIFHLSTLASHTCNLQLILHAITFINRASFFQSATYT